MSSLFQPIDIATEKLIELYKRSIGGDFLTEDSLELVQLRLIYLGTDSNNI